jgi:hypothetical protein
MKKLLLLLIPVAVFAGDSLSVVDTEAVGGIKAWLIGIGISVALAAAVRFFPKQKLIDIVSPVCFGAGKIVSKFMLLRLGKKAANSIEEGVFVTLSSVIYAVVDSFMKGLLEDNKEEEINKIKEDMRKNNPLFNIKLPK